MEMTGRIENITQDWKTGEYHITFAVNERPGEEINDLSKCEKLNIDFRKFRNKRSLDANGMLWACLGQIAATLRTDKWDVYLRMLRRYGQYTYVCVKPHAVEAMKANWRECEVIGELDINGQKAVQMLCYFGSSTYDTKDFSILLDGVISEMEEMGLPVPPSEDMKRALESWEKMHEKHNSNG